MFLSYIHRLLELLYIYIYIYIFIYLFIYLFIRVYIYLLFIQKGYFIARGVLLSLGFGTRFPTRVFSPFHACLVPLNKLLVFFFFVYFVAPYRSLRDFVSSMLIRFHYRNLLLVQR